MRGACRAWKSLLAAVCGLALLVSATGCDETLLEQTCRKVVFDYSSHAFTVERRFTADDAGLQVEWLERVKSDGAGHFQIELLERNGLARAAITDPHELAAFDRLAAQLATGGGMRALFQRDATPDDLDRMAANYWITIVELGREPITARGEPSLTFLIEPVVDDRPFYVLTASTRVGREGFPLEYQEYVKDPSGSRMTSHMVVTSLRWGPPSGLVPNESPIVTSENLPTLDTARLHAAALGLTLVLPKDGGLPAGFELIEIQEVSIQTEANQARALQPLLLWRFVYSDGVEHIDFIEHSPLDTMPSGYASNSYFDVAFVSRFGSISSASLLHRGTQVTIESRIAADRFGALLGSLVAL